MKIYRGLKNILLKNIDPLYQNKSLDAWHLTYGLGTSYSFDSKLAEDYCRSGRDVNTDVSFGLLLEYNFNAKKLFTINEKHFFDEDDNEAGFFLDNKFVESKNLAKTLNDKGFDAVEFDLTTAGFEHVLLLDNCSRDQLELICVKLYAEGNNQLQKLLNDEGYKFDGQYYIVPLNQMSQIDELLVNFIS